MSFGNLTGDNNFVDVILVCEDGQWMEGHNSNNDININQHRYRIFIDFWGRGWSETVRSVQIKDGHCHGVYLETYSNEFLDGEAPILAHGRWLVEGSRNTFAEEDDSVLFI